MKRKLWLKLSSLLVVLVLLLQCSVANVFAAQLAGNPTDSRINQTATAQNDFIGMLQRSIFYSVLYMGGIHEYTQNFQLTGFQYKAQSDVTLIHAIFKSGDKNNYVMFEMSVTIGTKEFWNSYLQSKEFKEGSALNYGAAIFGWLSVFLPGQDELITSIRDSSTANTFSTIMLKNEVKKLVGDDSLAVIPTFERVVVKNGVPVDRFPSAYITDQLVRIPDSFIPDLPDNVPVPNWVYNGVTSL